jgi:hypothetical protein
MLGCVKQIQIGVGMYKEPQENVEQTAAWEDVTIRIPAELAKRLKDYCESRRVNIDLVMKNVIGGFLELVKRRQH